METGHQTKQWTLSMETAPIVEPDRKQDYARPELLELGPLRSRTLGDSLSTAGGDITSSPA